MLAAFLASLLLVGSAADTASAARKLQAASGSRYLAIGRGGYFVSNPTAPDKFIQPTLSGNNNIYPTVNPAYAAVATNTGSGSAARCVHTHVHACPGVCVCTYVRV